MSMNNETRRLTRAESKARTRAKLLEAGGDLFAEHGFHAVAVETIVERAGFTRGAFYANFKDKADLLLTLIEESREAEMARVTAVVEGTPDLEKLTAVQGWFDGLSQASPWGLAYLELWPVASRDPALRPRLAAFHAAQRSAIAAILDGYCRAAGITLSIPAEEFGGLMLALGDGLATQRGLDKTAMPADAFTRGMALLWFGMMHPDAAAVVKR